MLSTEYGRKLGQAFKAVRKLHEQTAQLLRDCDREMVQRDYDVAAGQEVSRPTSRKIDKPEWIVDLLYRAYSSKRGWNGRLLNVTVVFFAEDEVPEPLLFVGMIQYRDTDGKNLKDFDVNALHMYDNTGDWEEILESLGSVRKRPGESGGVDWSVFIVRPLLSIQKFEDVREMINRVEHFEG